MSKARPQTVNLLRSDVNHSTGHLYRYLEAELENLSEEALLNLRRLICNLKEQARMENRRARQGGW